MNDAELQELEENETPEWALAKRRVAECLSMLERYLVRKTGDENLAMDVVNRVVDAFKKRKPELDVECIYPYLRSAAINTLNSILRKKKAATNTRPPRAAVQWTRSKYAWLIGSEEELRLISAKLAEHGIVPPEAKQAFAAKSIRVNWDRTRMPAVMQKDPQLIRSSHGKLLGWVEDHFLLLYHPAWSLAKFVYDFCGHDDEDSAYARTTAHVESMAYMMNHCSPKLYRDLADLFIEQQFDAVIERLEKRQRKFPWEKQTFSVVIKGLQTYERIKKRGPCVWTEHPLANRLMGERDPFLKLLAFESSNGAPSPLF